MKRSPKLSREHHQKDILVHYDLAITKLAHQIQSTEATRFDDVFTCIGFPHIDCSFFLLGALPWCIRVTTDTKWYWNASSRLTKTASHKKAFKPLKALAPFTSRCLTISSFQAIYETARTNFDRDAGNAERATHSSKSANWVLDSIH